MPMKSLVRFLISMKTTIALFIILGVVASFGTLIPQGLSSDWYLEHYGTAQGQFVLTLGLDDLYRAWWFIALGLVLIALLLFCTLRRMRAVRSLVGAGSIALHLAIVLVVLGVGISAITGVDEIVQVGIGENMELSNGSLKGYEIGVEDFRISYYDNGSPSQYDTDITVTDTQGVTFHEHIWVNEPYRRDHIKVYQQSYGWEVFGSYESDEEDISFRLKEGAEQHLEDGTRLMTVFIPHFDERAQTMESLSPEPRNPVLAVGKMQGEHLQHLVLLRPSETTTLGAGEVSFEKYAPYAGLHVKRDMGIPVIFAGFVFFILGLALRYLPTWFVKRRA